MFIAFLYIFRATMCPSSGEIAVPMRHLVLVTLYRWLSGMQSIKTVIYIEWPIAGCLIGTVISPDDGHIVARNMYRKGINILRKCVHQVSIYEVLVDKLTVSQLIKKAPAFYVGSTRIFITAFTTASLRPISWAIYKVKPPIIHVRDTYIHL